jgi:hypothetical protein
MADHEQFILESLKSVIATHALQGTALAPTIARILAQAGIPPQQVRAIADEMERTAGGAGTQPAPAPPAAPIAVAAPLAQAGSLFGSLLKEADGGQGDGSGT